MTDQFDVAVLGAGPAGISAALEAQRRGLRTVLLDEQAAPGGVIYRNITTIAPRIAAVLGKDYQHGRTLTDALAASGVTTRFATSVWDIRPGLRLFCLQQGAARLLRARHLILAVGAMERPTPVPGWTLPGVMNAGAAQLLLKQGAAPAGRTVLVGDGPLLLLLASQLIRLNAPPAALVLTSPHANLWRALRHLPAALRASGELLKGLGLLRDIRRAGIPCYRGAHDLTFSGQSQVDGITFCCGARSHQLAADTVLLHHGVTPNVQIARMLGLSLRWSESQLAWQVACDAYGRSSDPTISICGDGGAIDGARAAELTGRLAALDAACALGKLNEEQRRHEAVALQRALARRRAIRPFLDALYRPPVWLNAPPDRTLICRCEEVTAGEIRQMARLGCDGPNQTKFFTRAGMGPCQGRQCGMTLCQLLADATGKSLEETGYHRIRAPLKPVPLAALALLDADEA